MKLGLAAGNSVVAVWVDHHIELNGAVLQGADHLHGVLHMYIVVTGTENNQQVAL